jgi:hypothetical protein
MSLDNKRIQISWTMNMLACKILGGESYCKKLSFLSKEFAIITFPNTSSILHVKGNSQI